MPLRATLAGLLAAVGSMALLGCSAPSGGSQAAPAAPGAALAFPPTAPAPAPTGSPAPAGNPGPRAEGEAYEVALEAPAAAAVGRVTVARVVVTARGPYHVNRDYPMAFRPDASTRPAFAADRVPLGAGAARTACKDFPGEDCSVSAPLEFTAAPGGETRLSGTVAFSVCNPDRCLIEKVPLSATVAGR